MPKKKHQDLGVLVKDSETSEKKFLTPELLWPLFDWDHSGLISRECGNFPEISDIEKSMRALTLYDGKIIPGSKKFWDKFLDSDKVIFIDRFFSTDEMEKMFYELQTRSENGNYPSDIAIICINYYREVNTMNRQRRNVPSNIHVHKMLPTSKKDAVKNIIYDIHDRFAIMDNEIWHFGSTLGGHMKQLTAFSRGWTDINGKFREYAQSLINKNFQ